MQELHLHQRSLYPPPNFSPPVFSVTGDLSNHTGSALFVHHTLPFTTLPLNTPLQAVAVRLSQTKPLTVCSLYLPPSVPYTAQDLQHLLSQLPPPLLLVGDFNLRHTLWGDTVDSPMADNLISLLSQFSLSCLNNGQPTFERLNPPSTSCIDISFSSSSLLPNFHWKRLSSLYGSDHYPIIITSAQHQTTLPPPPKWNFSKANWPSFSSNTSIPLSPFNPSFPTVDDAYTHFQSIVSSAATNWIPQVSSPTPVQTPWWNYSCKHIHALKEHLYRQYKKHRTPTNLTAYKAANATCRRTFVTLVEHTFVLLLRPSPAQRPSVTFMKWSINLHTTPLPHVIQHSSLAQPRTIPFPLLEQWPIFLVIPLLTSPQLQLTLMIFFPNRRQYTHHVFPPRRLTLSHTIDCLP